MISIANWFYKKDSECKDNVYKNAFMEILTKRKNSIFSVAHILNIYSSNSKKKISDIMGDIQDIKLSLDSLVNDKNIVQYCFLKNNKMCPLYEYSIIPMFRDKNDLIENIINNELNEQNELINEHFSVKTDIETVRDTIIRPKKYINISSDITIDNEHILNKLISLKEDELLDCFIEHYKIHITDLTNDNTPSYQNLLSNALSINSCSIVNILNKHYYKTKYGLEIEYKNCTSKENLYNSYITYCNFIMNVVIIPIMIMSYKNDVCSF